MEGLNEWLGALRSFTRTPEAARAFQDLRFRFAHTLGNELIRPRDGITHVRGPVLYGIYLDRIGPLYVGQTTEAERRLRDLPIGESHHLANTFPPEVWDRIVVIPWKRALSTNPQASQALARISLQHDDRLIGLELEHLLHRHETPLFSLRRKTTQGGWRPVDPARSKSAGALIASSLQPIWGYIQSEWKTLATVSSPGVTYVGTGGWAVFPPVIRRQVFETSA